MSDAEVDSTAGPPIDEVTDRPAAAAGVVAAGVALAAAFLPWTDAAPLVPSIDPIASTPGAALAGLAVAAFLARRYDAIDRRSGAWTAGIACAGVILIAVARFVAPATGGGSAPAVDAGLPLAALAGLLGVGLARADATSVPASGLVRRTRRAAEGLGLLVGAFAVLLVLSIPLSAFEFDPLVGIGVSVLVTDLVFVTVALGFLLATDRGLGFVDLAWPDVRDVAFAGAGIVALFVGLIGVRLIAVGLGLPATGNRITDAALQGHPETLLLLIPLQFLLVGPAEELFNRNVVQKYLYGAFSRPAAVVVASGIFGVAHLFSYGGENPVGTFVSLASVFVLSLVLGAIYERTENLVVPAFVHGLFNAVQFALLYVVIVYGDVDPSEVGVVLPPW